MLFVSNLRKQSIEAFENQNYLPNAWLLSTHRLNNRTLQLALSIRDEGVPLFSDNGTKQLIEKVIKIFKEDSNEISSEVTALKRRLGKIPRGKNVPSNLRQRASNLAHQVVNKCEEMSETIQWHDLLEQQLSMKPTHLIAQEDFAIACLISLHLEREITGWPIRYFNKRNQRSLELWKRIMKDSRCSEIKVYAVLGAMDYNTAFSAGKLAASYGATHIAIGMVGIMRNMKNVDFYVKGHGNYKLNPPALRRYVRLAQITHGIADGYHSMGVHLKRFHALGLGAPTMFPVLVAAMNTETSLSVDATSPIHDAVRDLVMYDPERNGDRISLWQIVDRIVNGLDWPFKCSFCKNHRNQHGYRPEIAREWWKQANKPFITKEHLRSVDILSNALPLFSLISGSTKNYPIHISHNHWVLGELNSMVPEGNARIDWARIKIEEMLTYESTKTSRGLFAAAKILKNSK